VTMAASSGKQVWEWLLKLPGKLVEANVLEIDLELSGLLERVKITNEFVDNVLFPAIELVRAELRETELSGERKIVAIVGPPGVGKTSLTNLLTLYFQEHGEGQRDGEQRVASLSMDAYHLPNLVLEARGLRSQKGQAATMDGESLRQDIDRLRISPRINVSLPVYDRSKHEPVADALRIHKSIDVVLIEGIHLIRSEEPWQSLSFDAWIFLSADEQQQICRERVIARKVGNKVPENEAEQHYERVDAENFRRFVSDARKALSLVDRPRRILNIFLSMHGPPITMWHGKLVQNFCGDDAFLKLPSNADAESSTTAGASQIPKLVILGPNPALQKTMVFTDGLHIDEVNRASQLEKSVGGKGQQAARAATNFNALHSQPVTRVELVHFLGGANGLVVETMLQDKGVPMRTVHVSAETRTCLTMVDKRKNQATEVIEPSGEISPEEYFQLIDTVQEISKDAAAIAICGTSPPGAATIYEDIVNSATAPVFLDAYKGVETALHKVSLLKINATELRSLAKECNKTVDTHCLFTCAKTLFAHYQGLQSMCVTDGPFIANAFSRNKPDSYTEFTIPSLNKDELVNPIGAGDTVLAVTASSLVHGYDMIQSFARGLAAGSASCMELGGADFAERSLRMLLPRVAYAEVSLATRPYEF